MTVSLTVLYEDNHLFIVEKPPGLATQPNGVDPDSLESLAKARIKETHAKPGNVFLHAIHRIDKPVSGIVVFAKTSKALSRLNEAMRSGEIKKTYVALVEGRFPFSEGILEHYLTHGDFRAEIGRKHSPEAKFARLRYKVLESLEKRTRLEIDLETGRYHQIRAQFAAEGFPVWGDTRYGSGQYYPDVGIALHHGCLQLTHPVTGMSMKIDSMPPF